ncbi:MAG: stage III sporulation protein SpoIIIAA [Paraglaciecola sp.]|jgi:stage III sporulation protein SpoIIIAA
MPEGINSIGSYHGNWVEGLASAKLMREIWQQAAKTLADDHKAWV